MPKKSTDQKTEKQTKASATELSDEDLNEVSGGPTDRQKLVSKDKMQPEQNGLYGVGDDKA